MTEKRKRKPASRIPERTVFPKPVVRDPEGNESAIPKLPNELIESVTIRWVNGATAEFDMSNRRPCLVLVDMNKAISAVGQGLTSDLATLCRLFLASDGDIMRAMTLQMAERLTELDPSLMDNILEKILKESKNVPRC